LALFVGTLAILSLQRLAILSAMPERFPDSSGEDLATSLIIGWRFDMAVACFLLLPLVGMLVFMPRRMLTGRRYQRIAVGYAAGISALLVFTCVIDFYFFKEFDERLNNKALAYLEYSSTYKYLWAQYPLLTVFGLTLVVYAVFVGMFRRIGFHTSFDGRAARHLVVWRVAALPLLVVGIRGGLGPQAMNSGVAHFSPDQTLAQLTLNGPYSFQEALSTREVKMAELGEYLDLLPQDEAVELSRRLLWRPGDRFLDDPDRPMLRVTETGRPRSDHNVVLVIMESLSWHYVESLGGLEGLTPNLDALAADGVLMDRCFSVGTRTQRGIAGVLAGHPDLPGISVTTREEALGRLPTLAKTLSQRDYETLFVYGGQPDYDHMQAFLQSNGFERMLFEDQFTSRTYRTHLGWCDEDLFAEAHREFEAMGDKPFFATLLSLSFHRPFSIPDGREPGSSGDEFTRQLDSIRYADAAIGSFMDRARGSDYFDDTIFVFVSDHPGGFMKHPIGSPTFRVPFLIYAPSILGSEGRRISGVCSQTDVAPTILSLLGGNYEHGFFGSSVLDRPDEAGFALLQRSSGNLALLTSSMDLIEIPFNTPGRLYRYVAPDGITSLDMTDPAVIARRDELYRQAVALLQSASMEFERSEPPLANR
jgi:phosphoglycerol transferase MdoB-like AlkP superfamily enzyme